MTSIVNFEEEFKSNENLTNTILKEINRIHDAKLSGALKSDEFAKTIMMESKLFANLIKFGKKSEEDVDSYESLIPKSSKYFSINHKYLKEAFDYTKESNTDALMQRENWDKQSQPVESYYKGLKKVA